MTNPKKKKNKKSPVRIVLYSSFMAMTVGIIFAVVFFLGESYNFLPTISLGELPFGESGDVIIFFVIVIKLSIFYEKAFYNGFGVQERENYIYYIRHKCQLNIHF